nr:hypothetical protein CFP56_23651 [Quercus suber]
MDCYSSGQTPATFNHQRRSKLGNGMTIDTSEILSNVCPGVTPINDPFHEAASSDGAVINGIKSHSVGPDIKNTGTSISSMDCYSSGQTPATFNHQRRSKLGNGMTIDTSEILSNVCPGVTPINDPFHEAASSDGAVINGIKSHSVGPDIKVINGINAQSIGPNKGVINGPNSLSIGPVIATSDFNAQLKDKGNLFDIDLVKFDEDPDFMGCTLKQSQRQLFNMVHIPNKEKKKLNNSNEG